MAKRCATCLIFCFAFLACPPAEEEAPAFETIPYKYWVSGPEIKNQAGDTLYLRGMNVENTMKDIEGYLIEISDEEITTLKASGITMIRLLTFWTAINPEEGKIDHEYIDGYLALLKRLTDAGFWVVVDMHQDLWGQPFRSHGAPPWACPEELQEGYETISPWWANYASEQVSACFDHFWDTPQLHEKFFDAWRVMAEQTCDNDMVLGFDVINEPYTGQIHMTEDFDIEYLMPFYEKAMAAIDEVCDDRLYFLEPSSLRVLGIAEAFDIPKAYEDRIVYSGHFYPRYVHEPEGGGYDGDKEALIELFRKQFGPHIDADRAIWVGEYGGYTESPNYELYLKDLHGYWEENKIHHAYWDYRAADGYFNFRNAAKERKPVFDSVFPLPLPRRLPGGATVTPDYETGQVDVSFKCTAGQTGEVLMPYETCGCVAADDIFDNITKEDYLMIFECMADGQVDLDCNCEE
ncbi:MAG: hypothetical protein CMH56_09855 [Myxococcales bacterium]|nr:hypothetical protein [Myxococcales bacterium]|tara:strand:+ start:3185 stop:4573 length:1389 start_codon:yes stop_codon:yes gene_type:complete